MVQTKAESLGGGLVEEFVVILVGGSLHDGYAAGYARYDFMGYKWMDLHTRING